MAYGPEIRATYDDGAKLALRQPSEADLAPFFPVAPQLWQFTGTHWREYFVKTSPADYIANILDDPQRLMTSWGVYVSRPNDTTARRFVGTAGVHEQAWFHTQILDPNALRQKIGKRASALAVAAAFVLRPALHEIVTYVEPENEVSLLMVRGLGMVQDATYQPAYALSTKLKFGLPRPELPEQNALPAAVHALGQGDLTDVSFVS